MMQAGRMRRSHRREMVWNTDARPVTHSSVDRVKQIRPYAAQAALNPAAFLAALCLVILAGCTTAPAPAPAPAEAVAEVAPPEPEPPGPEPLPEPVVQESMPVEVTNAPRVVEEPVPEPVPHPGERMMIRIESVPPGAMIVIDGRPVGRAPIEIGVDTANNGFFREPVSIRARFVAGDATGESLSVDERLGPLERVPLALVFSREGVQRVIRQH